MLGFQTFAVTPSVIFGVWGQQKMLSKFGLCWQPSTKQTARGLARRFLTLLRQCDEQYTVASKSVSKGSRHTGHVLAIVAPCLILHVDGLRRLFGESLCALLMVAKTVEPDLFFGQCGVTHHCSECGFRHQGIESFSHAPSTALGV